MHARAVGTRALSSYEEHEKKNPDIAAGVLEFFTIGQF
jgi:hypothetical protein